MTRIVVCASGKGGVGKTTLVANLGTALAQMGKDVIVVDANLTTPNLGMHLGVPLFPTTLHDVLKGKAKIADAMYEHSSGLKIIPAGISLRDLRGVDPRDLPNALLDLLGHADLILVDAAAGLGREALAALEAADELLLITSPDLPSVTDALKASKLAEQVGTRVRGVVLNRVTGKPHEMSRPEIAQMLDAEILAEIPEDVDVQKGTAHRTPVVQHAPKSKPSREIQRLALAIAGLDTRVSVPWHRRYFGFLFR